MEKQKKIIKNLLKIEEGYILKIGEMYVEIAYSENDKSFNECMLNILRKKIKK